MLIGNAPSAAVRLDTVIASIIVHTQTQCIEKLVYEKRLLNFSSQTSRKLTRNFAVAAILLESS
jgi:hypothetical protein